MSNLPTPFRSFTDDLGRVVQIPTTPRRIASLHDTVLTLSLIELGVFPVGSHGRISKEGVPFIRASKVLNGYDFDNCDIKFLGRSPIDIDKLISVKPDLIISTLWQKLPIEQLEAIAPTLILDFEKHTRGKLAEIIADATNTQSSLTILKRRFEAQIERIKEIIDTQQISVNIIQPHNGKILVFNSYFSMGEVLRDAGFKFPDAVNDIPLGDCKLFEPDELDQIEADFVFATYRTDKKHTPQYLMDEFIAIKSDFVESFAPCRQGRLLFIPREEASGNSFAALGICAATILNHVAGHPYPII
ncbi:MAG: preprotein translocase YidC [Hyphomicrobiales bacterium]|nr:MAG: preprotein translocase YidC [Hyphomicrobiales bacterium]